MNNLAQVFKRQLTADQGAKLAPVKDDLPSALEQLGANITGIPSKISRTLRLRELADKVFSEQNKNAFTRGALSIPSKIQGGIGELAKAESPIVSTIPKEVIGAGESVSTAVQKPTPKNIGIAALKTAIPVARVGFAPTVGIPTYVGSTLLGGALSGTGQMIANAPSAQAVADKTGKGVASLEATKELLKGVPEAIGKGAQKGVVDAPLIGGIAQKTQPIIEKISATVLSKLPPEVSEEMGKAGINIFNRIMQGGLSVPQGKVIAESLGVDYTPVDIALDFAIGSGMAKKVGKGTQEKVEAIFPKITEEQKLNQQQGFVDLKPGQKLTLDDLKKDVIKQAQNKPVGFNPMEDIAGTPAGFRAAFDKARVAKDTTQMQKLISSLPNEAKPHFVQQMDEVVEPLLSEARKYKSAEEFESMVKIKNRDTYIPENTLNGELKQRIVQGMVPEEAIRSTLNGKNAQKITGNGYSIFQKENGQLGVKYNVDIPKTDIPSIKKNISLTADALEKYINKHLNPNIEVLTDNSRVSGSRYIQLHNTISDDFIKIRVSDHDLPYHYGQDGLGDSDININIKGSMLSSTPDSTMDYLQKRGFISNVKSTKSQLTDIWNQAQVQGVATEKPIPQAIQKKIVSTEPIINMKRDVQLKDIHGQKVTLPEGEAYTPYTTSDNKIVLKDGDTFVVNKGAYETAKQNAIKAEPPTEFAPELKGLEETVKGYSKQTVAESKLKKLGYNVEQAMGGDEIMITDKKGDVVKYDEAPPAIQKLLDDFGGTPTKYHGHNTTIPNGENYREILIRAPEQDKNIKMIDDASKIFSKLQDKILKGTQTKAEEMEYERVADIVTYTPDPRLNGEGKGFQSSHWDEPNVLSHIRMNDRATPDGKKVAFLEELQSDWAREARKYEGLDSQQLAEYDELVKKWTKGTLNSQERSRFDELKAIYQKSPTYVPNHPLLKNWQELSIKRALKDAAEGDAEYFAWINGDQTKARYNLSTQVDRIEWKPQGELKLVNIYPNNGTRIELLTKEGNILEVGGDARQLSQFTAWKGKNVAEVVGKGVGEKITTDSTGKLQGEGLNIGGEWANNLYDKQIKSIVEKLTGKKVETIDMGLLVGEDKSNWVHSGSYEKVKKLKVGDLIHNDIPGGSPDLAVTQVTGDTTFEAIPVRLYEDLMNPNTRLNSQLRSEGYETLGDLSKNQRDEFIKSQIDVFKKSYDFAVKNKSKGQQAIRLTPDVKAKILGKEIPLKKPSGVIPEYGEKTGKSMINNEQTDDLPYKNESNYESWMEGTVASLTDNPAKYGISDETSWWIDDWNLGDDIIMPSKKTVMELSKYKPTEPIKLYRGVGKNNKIDKSQYFSTRSGYESWTRDKKVAEQYAGNDGTVFEAVVDPKDILVSWNKLPKWIKNINKDSEREVVVRAGKYSGSGPIIKR